MNKGSIAFAVAIIVMLLLLLLCLCNVQAIEEQEEIPNEAEVIIVSLVEPVVVTEDEEIPVEEAETQQEAEFEPSAEDCTEEDTDIVLIAKTLYGECRGCSKEEQAKVAWVILNRVDCERFPNTVREVVTAPCQFVGYSENNPVTDEQYAIALDVVTRWQAEKNGETVERELSSGYLYCTGDGVSNYFREEF